MDIGDGSKMDQTKIDGHPALVFFHAEFASELTTPNTQHT